MLLVFVTVIFFKLVEVLQTNDELDNDPAGIRVAVVPLQKRPLSLLALGCGWLEVEIFEELGGGDDALEKSEENRTDGEEFVDEDVGGTASADFDTTITLDNKSTTQIDEIIERE